MSIFRKMKEAAGQVIHGPARYKALQEEMAEQQAKIAGLQARMEEDEKQLWAAHERMNEQTQAQFRGEKEAVQAQFAEQAAKMEAESRKLQEVYSVDTEHLNLMIRRLCESSGNLEKLNLFLSFHRTVWGDPGRLRIAESARMGSCVFNTNSGTVTVGEYSFAGSGVSILAGSHDMRRTGEARLEDMKDGCDIVIGNGVWLASGCTLLGPCRIGDNAVIAAGAVVTPGTEVPAGAVYGGVPARLIRMIDAGEGGAK